MIWLLDDNMFKIFKKKQSIRSLIISIILVLILIYFNKIPLELDYGIFLSISVSLFGFLITALSILLVFPENGRIGLLKQHKDYELLFMIFLFSIVLQVIIFSLSLIGTLFYDFYFMRIITLFFLILSLQFIILDLWILKRMINILFKEE